MGDLKPAAFQCTNKIPEYIERITASYFYLDPLVQLLQPAVQLSRLTSPDTFLPDPVGAEAGRTLGVEPQAADEGVQGSSQVWTT